jgi:hypothetical protein
LSVLPQGALGNNFFKRFRCTLSRLGLSHLSQDKQIVRTGKLGWRLTNGLRGMCAAVAVLLISGCASVVPEQTQDPEVPVFLPTTSLTEGLGVMPNPLSESEEQLKASFNKYEVDEAPAGSDVDYYLNWGDLISKDLRLSDASLEADRNRDKVSLQFDAISLTAFLDGRVKLRITMVLVAEAGPVTAFCNGILIEVANEAFKLPSKSPSCLYDDTDQYDFDLAQFNLTPISANQSDGSATELRMFQLMSQNTFRVKVIDVDGNEHVFTFDIDQYDNDVQYFLKTALEAEKAIQSGLGY